MSKDERNHVKIYECCECSCLEVWDDVPEYYCMHGDNANRKLTHDPYDDPIPDDCPEVIKQKK